MQRLTPVTYDRHSVSVGILHFGVGNFHRSHQAMYLDRLLRQGVVMDWGICGVGVLKADAAMRDALRSQGLEYTLVERHPVGAPTATRIGSIVGYLYAPDELDAVLERLADPAIRIVSLTITEGGYNISDETGEFDVTTPSIVADAQPGAKPATVFGIILAGLRLRRGRGIPPFTVLSCDNLQQNGDITRNALVAFAAMVDTELAAWVARVVSFPNCMVDRITPVTSDEDRQWVAQEFGVTDAWPVVAEPFTQWVLEDHFPLGRPPLELAGVQLVDDVRPYQLMKMRLLNASHQAMAYFGILKGHTLVEQAATDPQLVDLIVRYMAEEAAPTLEPVPGVDLGAYEKQVVQRFANPYMGDTLARLATDGSDRIPKFVVPVARERRAKGQAAPLSAAVIASWARYAELALVDSTIPFNDRQRDAVAAAVARQQVDPVGYLRNTDWFGTLADDPEFCASFVAVYRSLRELTNPADTWRNSSPRGQGPVRAALHAGAGALPLAPIQPEFAVVCLPSGVTVELGSARLDLTRNAPSDPERPIRPDGQPFRRTERLETQVRRPAAPPHLSTEEDHTRTPIPRPPVGNSHGHRWGILIAIDKRDRLGVNPVALATPATGKER
jgi:mannitol 2-dehydrogenase